MKLKNCLAAATVAACFAAAPALADTRVSIGIGIPIAPPVAVYEAPPPVAVGYVWAPGYWAWHGDRYIWIRCRTIVSRPGYVWAPDRWEHRGGHYHHVHGGWGRDPHWRGRHGQGHGRGHDRH